MTFLASFFLSSGKSRSSSSSAEDDYAHSVEKGGSMRSARSEGGEILENIMYYVT